MSQPNKRKLSMSPTSDSNKKPKAAKTDYERSQDIYFDDGNLIIVADEIAFRVHRGLLARHSEVFRDMFTVVEQPPDAENFDGCPVVHLSDNWEDVVALLDALYSIPRIKEEPNDDRFDKLASILRLATKYLIDDLRNYARDVLGRAFPTTLEEWDSYKGYRICSEYVIVLARETGTTSLLPAAFYALCQQTSHHVLNKPIISLPDIYLYSKGKDKVAATWPNFLKDEWNSTQEEPCGDHKCRKVWTSLMEEEQWGAFDFHYWREPDPLHEFLRYSRTLDEYEGLCPKDKKAAKLRVEQKRGEIWESLPKYFGLETWEDLKKCL